MVLVQCHDGIVMKLINHFFPRWYFDHGQCAATREWHATDTEHDAPPHHSIQTQGQPVVVISIDVECHAGIHNYPFQCLGSDPIRKSFPDLPHTPANAQLYDANIVEDRPGTCGERTTLHFSLPHSCFST